MNIEKPYLAVMLALLLFLGVGTLWDHRLVHDFPYAYLASDTFQQQTRAQGIADAGSYVHEPPYIVKGYTDVIGYYPPVLHHLGILLGSAAGIPLYDAIYFAVFLAAIAAAFVMYIIIRSASRQAALLALPMSLLLFSDKSYIGFLWGHWASILGQMFLICVFWAVLRHELEGSWILLGLFMGALALSHTSELLYGAVFVALYGVYLLATAQFTKRFLMGVVLAAVLAGIIAFYNLLIFVQSFQVINPYTFTVSKDWGGTPIFYLTDFGVLLVFMAIGLVASLMLFRKVAVPLMAGIFMLLAGYANYIGFGIRAFQPRLLWPVYLMFFFGLGLWALIKYAPEAFRFPSLFGVVGVFLVLFSGMVAIPGVPAYDGIGRQGPVQGLMDAWHWEAFQWLGKDTPADAKVYFFYGDVYDQDALLRNAKRTHVQVVPDDFIAKLQNRSIARIYWSDTPADHGAGMPYWKSFGKIGLHQREDGNGFMWQRDYDVCDFDYIVFDKASRQQVLAQYNLLIAQDMVDKGASVAFQNDVVIILRNNAKGGDCIEERTF